MWNKYIRTGISEMRPYILGEDLEHVSVGEGISPKDGDMIARDPDNHEDKWLVTKEYFDKNLELL